MNQSMLSDKMYSQFRALIRAHSGLAFPAYRRADLEAGLAKALKTTPSGAPDAQAYYDFLTETSGVETQAEVARLINFLTIGETHFFRNKAHFNALETVLLPDLIRQKRQQTGRNGLPTLRLWSAGCASGEEPYSLAILLHELIPDIARWHILILATDINSDTLVRARQACYSGWSFREERALARQQRYFAQQAERYQLTESIRQMVTFARHNLVEDDFPAFHNNTSFMDLIICRNVTVYFDEETTGRIVNQFYQALVNEGWLLVGHSEPSLAMYRRFQPHTVTEAILYQKQNKYVAQTKYGAQTAPAPIKPVTETAVSPLTPLPSPPPTLPPPPTNQTLTNKPAVATEPLSSIRILLAQGKPEQAIAALHDHLDRWPATHPQRTPAYCLLAQAHANQKEWTEAQAWCKAALAQDPLCLEAYATLAAIHECTGNLDEAINNLKKVIYIDPKQTLSHFNLGMLYRKKGAFTQARRAFQNMQSHLQQYPPQSIVPHSGGSSAQRLQAVVARAIHNLETV
jgi:chemotaxis protein methyltransferase CheR